MKKYFLQSPIADDEKNRTAQLLNIILIVIILGLSLVLIERILDQKFRLVSVISGTIISLSISLYSLRKEKVGISTVILLFTLIIFLSYLAIVGEGINDSALFGFTGLLVIGGMILKRNQFIIVVAAVLFCMFIIGYLDVNHLLNRSYNFKPAYSDLMDILVIFLITAVAIWLISGSLLNSHARVLESKEIFAKIFNSNPAAISISSINEGYFYDVNQSFEKLLGYTRDELIGQSILKFGIYSDPSDRINLIDRLLEDESVQNREITLRRKDNDTIVVILSADLIHFGDERRMLTTFFDITERKKAEMELIKSRDKAEQSDRFKTEFLAQMSHEIRTPLNTIVSNICLIEYNLENKLSYEEKEYFQSINSASQRIIRTIELLLSMAELQSGAYIPSYNKIDLHKDVLDRLYKEFCWTAKSKGLDLIYSREIANSVIYGDKFSIAQIFTNLIDNAIKYSKTGTIEIKLLKAKDEDGVKVHVKDTGIGISPDFLHYIFEPFMQEERGYTRSFEGNGLGLSLVKKYCEINNATITVDSVKNVGSTFCVSFNNVSNIIS